MKIAVFGEIKGSPAVALCKNKGSEEPKRIPAEHVKIASLSLLNSVESRRIENPRCSLFGFWALVVRFLDLHTAP